MSCTQCDAIVPGRRNADGHDRLKAIGGPKTLELAQARVRIQQYICEVCESRWQYQDNRLDMRAGWTRLSR